jgi:hypothetical protein
VPHVLFLKALREGKHNRGDSFGQRTEIFRVNGKWVHHAWRFERGNVHLKLNPVRYKREPRSLGWNGKG